MVRPTPVWSVPVRPATVSSADAGPASVDASRAAVGDQITVRGGAHGLGVCLTELESAADVLEGVGRDVGEVAVVVGAAAGDPALAVAATLAPAEALAAESAILACAGVRGAYGLSVRVLATAEATRAAVVLYREGERAVESLFDGVATGAGVLVGAQAGAVAPGLAVGAAVLLGPRLVTDPGARGDALAVGLGLGQEVDEILADHPWLVSVAADGVDGVIIGLGIGVPGLGPWMRAKAARAGVPYPPRTQVEALALLQALTAGVALDESTHDVRVEARPPRPGRAPVTVEDLVARDPTRSASSVRITGVPQPDGSWTWVVDVPGTQTFDPRAGRNPWDLTSNVLLVAGEQTLTMQGVTRALADAERRTGARGRSRVVLTGHSQGGITAAALAADPGFRRRFDVTHVVTSGAPIGRAAVPESVSVLSLEHREDLVPALDGEDNPDRALWVTVERAVGEDLGPQGGASDAHDVDHYAQTARLVDQSTDPSLIAWRAGAADVLGAGSSEAGAGTSDGGEGGGEALVLDYDIERVARRSSGR